MRARAGWSLLEMLVAVTVLGILLGVAVLRLQPRPAQDAQDAATQFAHHLALARTTAVLQSGDVKLYVDTTGLGPRYLAARVVAGGDTTAADSAAWVDLPAGVHFAAGQATHGPLGDSIVTVLPQLAVTCPQGASCELGGAPVVTYYLAADAAPNAVFAVTLTLLGDTRLYAYDAATARWN